MAKPKVVRMSLAQHFAAPDNYVGEFGWLCGYSADESFMSLAAERFSGENVATRAASGCLRLGLLLDPGNPQLTSAAVPGVMHFPVYRADLPFVLLHAKVAVLGFRQLDDPARWQLRLLVSTGNWTRATLEGNIDLAWRIDVDSDTLDEAAKQDCADLAAAWGMLTWLRGFFDTRILDAVPAGRSDTDTSLAFQNLERWVGQASAHAKGKSRFIDNRGQSLWAHVQRKVKAEKDVRRNYLAIGSAYYQAAAGAVLPSVLETVVTGLKNGGVLTAKADIDVYVNPEACQAIAPAAHAIAQSGWAIRPPRKQAGQTFMHAKFVFSANFREGSNKCSSAWLYFGSGNLTGPGFLKKASTAGGNLEAGVVLAAAHMFWTQAADNDPGHVIENMLPLQWGETARPDGALHQGADMADREPLYVAPPLTYLMWQADGAQAGWLAVPPTSAQFDLLDSSGSPCPSDATARIRWHGARPIQVGLRWTADGRVHSAAVPVIDELGGIATTPAGSIALEQAGWELWNFPARPTDDDRGYIDDPEDSDSPLNVNIEPGRRGVQQYPIRTMMLQLDNIADVQCNVNPLDWRMWCNRLEQVLCRASDSAEVAAFRTLGIDPLSALLAPAFRPVYAESGQSEQGKRYEETLARIARAWKVNGLAGLEVPQ